MPSVRCTFENGEYHCGRYTYEGNLCPFHDYSDPKLKLYSTKRLIERNSDNGWHFFEPSAMRFFRSRVLSSFFPTADGGGYFVTSERFVSSQGNSEPRRYTVRKATIKGDVDKIAIYTSRDASDTFQHFATAKTALRWAEKLSKEEQ